MRAAKIYFYNRLVPPVFHAIDHSEFVETLLYIGFTHDQFCTIFNSMKMTVPFRRNNFSAGLVNVSLTAFYVHCTVLCDCFTLI